MFSHVFYGLGVWGYGFDAPDDAVRVWLLPYDWDVVEAVALMLVTDDERLDILSELVEISSN